MLFFVQFNDLYAFCNKASKIKIVVHRKCKGFQIMSISAFNQMHFQLQFKIKRKLRAFEQICLISD